MTTKEGTTQAQKPFIRYEYNYDFNPETALTRTKTAAAVAPSKENDDRDIRKSTLNLLLTAVASAIVTDESSSSLPQAQVIPSSSTTSSVSSPASSSSSSSSSSSQAPAQKIQAQPSLDRSKRQGNSSPPSLPFFVPPPHAFAQRPREVSSSPVSVPLSTAVPGPATHPTNRHSLQPSILAIFPHFPSSSCARSLPMPPGMEITLSPSTVIANIMPPATQKPYHESTQNNVSVGVGVDGSRGKLPHREHQAAKGKAAFSVHKASRMGVSNGNSNSNTSGGSRYKMKYRYVSMRRWEAHQYIESLAKGSEARYYTTTNNNKHHQHQPQQHVLLPWNHPANLNAILGAGGNSFPPAAFSVREPPPFTTRSGAVSISIPSTNSAHSNNYNAAAQSCNFSVAPSVMAPY